jgi:hypothetical protein
MGDNYSFNCIVDGTAICVVAGISEAFSKGCDVVLRLLAASVVRSVLLRNTCSRDGALINATSLAYLMEQCQSLKTLTLKDIDTLGEDQIRVLGAYSRPDLKIMLVHCIMASAGASALAEVLGRNQGPTKLDYCYIDNFVLTNGLRGNSRLKSLSQRFSGNLEVSNRELLVFAGALKENKGLVDLDLSHSLLSFETWVAVCDSLKTHPTLQVLCLRSSLLRSLLKSRIQVLLDMMKENMSIHTITIVASISSSEGWSFGILRRIVSARAFVLSKRLAQLCTVLRLLGQALFAARTDPNRFWMLLSGNPEVAFPSTTATTPPPGNLPTPATAASTAAAVSATVAVTVTVTATLADSTSDDSVADYVATPTVYQKRKARP